MSRFTLALLSALGALFVLALALPPSGIASRTMPARRSVVVTGAVARSRTIESAIRRANRSSPYSNRTRARFIPSVPKHSRLGSSRSVTTSYKS